MAPIVAPEEHLGLHTDQPEDTVLRPAANWDLCDADAKVVGSHLTLSRRPSQLLCGNTLMGGGGGRHHHMAASKPAALAALHAIEIPNTHRRLDRSVSEPVKQDCAAAAAAIASRAALPQANSSRYKTELCRPFEECGFCKYGDKCQFAHGQGELRTLSRHPKYKTELCRTFHSTGFCPYGTRCHFIHKLEEGRSPFGGGHVPLTATTSLNLNRSFLGSTADSPSPPASLHGSPTANSDSFFDESFPLFSKGSREGLFGTSKSFARDDTLIDLVDQCLKEKPGALARLMTLETPPLSPVDSLAEDLDTLSFSSAPMADSASYALDMRSMNLHPFEKFSDFH